MVISKSFPLQNLPGDSMMYKFLQSAECGSMGADSGRGGSDEGDYQRISALDPAYMDHKLGKWDGKDLDFTRFAPLRWRHNERDSVSNHQPHDCLLNRLFRRRSKKSPKLRVTGLGGPVNSPHKWPVTWKMFPFDDVIMTTFIDVIWSSWLLTSPATQVVRDINKGNIKAPHYWPFVGESTCHRVRLHW